MNNSVAEARDVTLLELLDRVIDHGVILSGDVTISVAAHGTTVIVGSGESFVRHVLGTAAGASLAGGSISSKPIVPGSAAICCSPAKMDL